jgi:hypothetical protein
MRLGSVIAALATALVLGGCGGGNGGSSSAAAGPAASTTTAQSAHPPQTGARTTASPAATQPATTNTPRSDNGIITTPSGQLERVAPGSRWACIHRLAPEFAPGQQRQAVLSQCRNLPR